LVRPASLKIPKSVKCRKSAALSISRLHGVTAVHDDAFHNPWPTRGAIDAVMSAYHDSGLRATVSINHPNRPELDKLPFLADMLPPDIRTELEAIRIVPLDELTGLYRWFHSTWHGAAGGRLRIAVSNSAPQRVTEEYFAWLSAFGREHDRVLRLVRIRAVPAHTAYDYIH